MRESIIFYRSFYEAIKDLKTDIQGEIYTAIMEYGLYGKETENLGPIARSIFTLVKPQIDKNIKRYENGCRGGRPNQDKTKREPNNNQNKTEQEPKEKDNVNDNNNIPPIIPPEGKKEGVGEEKNKRKRARPPIDTGFIEAPFREVMDKWLEYKRARGQTYKSETSIKTCYKKLLEMSGGDPVKAEAIVENSIANNYAGIFPLKNTSLYVTDKPTASTSLTEEERERSFLEHINRKLGNIP